MKRLVLIALLLISAIIWFGCDKEEQYGTITGVVTDAATGEPIDNANVKLNPRGETTLTGNDGSFQFNDMTEGQYSLSISKIGYVDLDDDYVINLEKGKTMRRDVQMRKQVASLQITDMDGNTISTLDFGLEESIISKSFNIFNNGTVDIKCMMSHNCTWIENIIAMDSIVSPGRTLTVTVIINRSMLLAGDNRTYLHIISNNGSNELEITARGYDVPTVTTNEASNITTTSATCGGNVTADGGTSVTDRGICWATSHAPTIESSSKMSLGTGNGNFSGVMSGLSMSTTYYVRAYATNQRGTSYGQEVQFTTADGTPIVTTIVPTKIGTQVTTGGNVESDEGSEVIARGVCWSLTPYPDLSSSHSHTENGSGIGTYSSTFEMPSTGIYYVRAYATNARGTAYGEQQTIGHPYNDLPTFTFGERTYRVAPPADNTMTWSSANSYCQNLTLYGYDWRLPTKDELLQMYQDRESIGGFNSSYWWSNTLYGYYSGNESKPQHYYVSFSNGACHHAGYSYGGSDNGSDNDFLYYVRPIRVEN